jgi:hypothetical protein
MWCHNAEGHNFSDFWVESDVMKWVGLVGNSSFAVGHPIVFGNECNSTGTRFPIAMNTTLILYILTYWSSASQ